MVLRQLGIYLLILVLLVFTGCTAEKQEVIDSTSLAERAWNCYWDAQDFYIFDSGDIDFSHSVYSDDLGVSILNLSIDGVKCVMKLSYNYSAETNTFDNIEVVNYAVY